MNKHVNTDVLVATERQAAEPAKSNRKKAFLALASTIAVAAGGFGVYQATVASRHVVTDNAYVEAETAQVTALTSGPIAQVRVVDTQSVRKGDILVVLDDTDRRLELQQALSALGQVERKVRSLKENSGSLGGQVAARIADLARTRAELRRAQAEYDRRYPLVGTGAISGEEMTSVKTNLEAAQAAYQQAEANLRGAQGALGANDALIDGVPLEENPEVTAARFRVEQAKVALSRTVVRAPVDGIVTKRTVQVGQMVQPGALMMTVVPIQQAYVTANFKEVQLAKVRVGQHVEVVSDLYGKDVVYRGRVVGFSGGTGAATAIVPAQNATGNWIKVVQRLPVRIALDPAQLAAHPLKVGLSMDVDIDVAG